MEQTKIGGQPKSAFTVVKGYKAFERDMTCLGFKYRVGRSYVYDGKISLCRKGFHFCRNPLDVLFYYRITDPVHEIEASGSIQQSSEGSKCVASRIKIFRRLTLDQFVESAIKYLRSLSETEIFSPQRDCDKYASADDRKKVLIGSGTYAATVGQFSQVVINGSKNHVISGNRYSSVLAKGNYNKFGTIGLTSEVGSYGDCNNLAIIGNGSSLHSLGNWNRIIASGNNSTLAVQGRGNSISVSGAESQVLVKGARGVANSKNHLASSGSEVTIETTASACAIAACGKYTNIIVSGNYSTVACCGQDSRVELNGQHGVAVNIGAGSRARGKKGNWIVLAEWQESAPSTGGKTLKWIKAAKIDGKRLKENTWYELKNGRFVECKQKRNGVH